MRNLALAMLLFVSPGAARSETVDTVRKSFKVEPGGQLVVDVGGGGLEVTAVPGKDLSVEVVRKVSAGTKEREAELLREHAPTFDQAGGTVTIRSPRRDAARSLWDFWRRDRVSVRYTIALPARFNADLNTSGGAIKVAGLSGTLRAETAGGGLEFTDVTGPIDGETSGGAIRLHGCAGTSKLHTSGGGVTVGSHRGDVTAETSGGGITVDGITGNVVAETAGGGIRAAWLAAPTAACRLETHGGGVSVTLPEKAGVDLDASTSGGGVRSEFAVDGTTSRQHVKGRINGGGPVLFLRTSGGGIQVARTAAAVSRH